MDGATAFRRAFHIASPAFLGYYLLPETIGGNITRGALAALFIGAAFCIEIARVSLRVKLFGMRPYEGQRMSAYAQGALGLLVGLFVVRNVAIVVPVFLGMAWIDPLAAEARRRGWPRSYPAVAYFALYLGAEALLSTPWAPPWSVVLAAAATIFAILVEGPRHDWIDDDLLMQIVPYAIVYFLAGLIVGSFL